MLGFADDVMMYVQKFAGQSGDMFGLLRRAESPSGSDTGSNPLRTAQDKLQLALSTYTTYQGYQDQLGFPFPILLHHV